MLCDYLQRKDVINGSVEPTDSDCDWPSDEEEEDEANLSVKAHKAHFLRHF